MRNLIAAMLIVGTFGCNNGGVCVDDRPTMHGGTEKVCQYGVSFDYTKKNCPTGFHPYSGEGSTPKKRGEDTCQSLGIRAEPH